MQRSDDSRPVGHTEHVFAAAATGGAPPRGPLRLLPSAFRSTSGWHGISRSLPGTAVPLMLHNISHVGDPCRRGERGATLCWPASGTQSFLRMPRHPWATAGPPSRAALISCTTSLHSRTNPDLEPYQHMHPCLCLSRALSAMLSRPPARFIWILLSSEVRVVGAPACLPQHLKAVYAPSESM